jgi:predicted transcriptional regulator
LEDIKAANEAAGKAVAATESRALKILEETKAELTKVQGELRNLKNENVVVSAQQSNLNPQHLKHITDIETEYHSIKQLIESIQNRRLTGFDD